MIQIRPVTGGDEAALAAFLARIPEGDRTFFKENELDREAVAAWVADTTSLRAVAVDPSGPIVGYVALLPGVGWSSHVGDLRLVVDPRQRRRGIGRQLASWSLLHAVQAGLAKVVVEVVAEQSAAIAMFQGLGFEAEALLKDHIRDREGGLRDLVVLAHGVDGNWSALATLGLEQE